jgi:4-amino-4-deoxy-L-arabinose transferase-like glycosyltransferase
MNVLPRKKLLFAFLLAFGIRLFFALTTHESADATDLKALNDLALWGGFGMPQAPLYPLILRVLYATFGANNLTAVFAFQAVVGSLTVFLTALIASRLWSEQAGLMAGLVGAVYPDFIFYGVSIETESLVVLCIVSMMAVAVLDMKDTLRASLLGIVLGLGVLIQVNLILFLPGLAILIPWIVSSSVAHRQFAPVQNARDYARVSMFKYFAENKKSLRRQMNRIYVNALFLYNRHYESREETGSVSEGTVNVSYFVRKYSYLVLLLLGSFATAKYLSTEHLRVALPPLVALALLILLVMLDDGRHRVFVEPLLIIYLVRMFDRGRPERALSRIRSG